MPFRNAPDFLDEAVESVLSQTHGRLELLLCDDGSTDASSEMARRWAARDPERIRYLEHPGHAHRGTAASRNLAIGVARGDLVAFLDADDRWEPSHLRHDVALLARHPDVGLVCGQALEWHSWTESTEQDAWTPLPWPPGSVVDPPGMLTAILRRGAYCTPVCSLLVRRELLKAVGAIDEQFTIFFEDQALLAKLHLSASSVVSGTHTAKYRRHPASTTARAVRSGEYDPGGPSRSHELFLSWLDEYVGRSKAVDVELRSALDAALAPYRAGGSRWRWKFRAAARAAIPPETRRVLVGAARRTASVGPVRMGSLRRLSPLAPVAPGLPLDGYYVEEFLTQNQHVINGRVLATGDIDYVRRFGGSGVTRTDVLPIEQDADLGPSLIRLGHGSYQPAGTYDCIVLVGGIERVHDLPGVVRALNRLLRPGGTLLATFHGIGPVAPTGVAPTMWSLTPASASRVFGDVFGPDLVEVAGYGNVLTATAFLHGLGAGDLRPRELRVRDPRFPVLVSVRAGRPTDDGFSRRSGRDEP